MDVLPAKKLDDKGRCCGRKPLRYARPPRLFCARCDAEFAPTGEQRANWAYRAHGEGFIKPRPGA